MELCRRTEYGIVQGFAEEDRLQWFGIPYALPPVGDLRFRRARKALAWKGVKQCHTMSARPYDFLAGAMKQMMRSETPYSEDCLYLNIWAPQRNPEEEQREKLPVFVWIYGGANHTGDTTDPAYTLKAFPRDGIVAVSFNYRVGPLGFYDFSRLDASFDTNCALSDMLLALQFVKDNISQFGGDPDNITICGESAGGTAVYTLLSCPAANGLFQKAIAMSGLPDNIDTPHAHDLNNEIFLNAIGIDKHDVQRLRKLTPEQLQAGSGAIMKNNDVYPGILLTGPVIDGDLLPYKPWEALRRGVSKDVVCLFGTCKDEGTLFTTLHMAPTSWEQVHQMLQNNGFTEKFESFRALYGHLPRNRAMAAIARDRMFWAYSIKCADAQSMHNAVYCYRFDFASGFEKLVGLGATHGSDIGPGLDTWQGLPKLIGKGSPMGKKEVVRDYLHNSFVHFVKSGSPSGESDVPWKKHTPERRYTTSINLNCSLEENPNEDFYALWKDISLY